MQPEARVTNLHTFRYGSGRVPLASVAQDLATLLAGAVVLAYSREACIVARLDAGRILDAAGKDWAGDASIYELRAFSANHELRWYSEPGQSPQGTAVVLSENPALPGTNWELGQTITELTAHPNEYLLWGAADNTNAKWTELVNPRIGTLWVPAPTSKVGARIVLRTIEYIGVEDLPGSLADHGNSAVIEERLCQLAERNREPSDWKVED